MPRCLQPTDRGGPHPPESGGRHECSLSGGQCVPYRFCLNNHLYHLLRMDVTAFQMRISSALPEAVSLVIYESTSTIIGVYLAQIGYFVCLKYSHIHKRWMYCRIQSF